MSTLSVRLPRDLDAALPKKDRSSWWVLEAIRTQLRRERIREIAKSTAEHAAEDLELLQEWEHASAPLPKPRKRRASR